MRNLLFATMALTVGLPTYTANCSATFWLRACLKIRKGAVFAPQAGWRGTTKENILHGSLTEEQRSQPACGAKTLRAAGLLSVGFVGSVLTARCGDARTSPPRPQPKSLAAAPFPIFRQALRYFSAPALKSGVAAPLCHRTPYTSTGI